MNDASMRPGPGWFADPCGALGTLRCWDGDHWTSRVVTADRGEADGTGESVSWRLDLPDLPPPEPAPAWEAPVAEAEAPPPAPTPVPEPTPVPSVVPSVGAMDPLVAAFGDEAEWVPDLESATTSRPRVGRRLVPALVAAALVALAAGAGAGIIGDGGRPEVEPATVYRDANAGFALRFPNEWKVDDKRPGESVRFTIGALDAGPTQTNTVTVVVGPTAAELPPLGTLADEVTRRLREQFAGIRLEDATRTRLAGAPALRLQLADVNDDPPTRIEQYVGRTTSGRPLTVTVTVREPRTAPTPGTLQTFIQSISPA